jgi:chromosome segregation ATPase
VSLFETENFEISEKLAVVETVLAEKELESKKLSTEKVMVTVKLEELETKFAILYKKSETDEHKIQTVLEELEKSKILSQENIRARANMESELSNLQMSHDSVSDQLEAVMCVEENNGKLSGTIEDLREEISQNLKTITGLKDSVLDLNTKLTVSEEQLEKVTVDFTEIDSKAKTDSCKLSSANEEIQDLTGLRAELEMTLNELKTQLKKNEERTETVLVEKSELEKQMKELNDQNTQFAKNHAQKSSELAKTEQNFISLSRESSDKDDKITELRNLVEDLKHSLIKSDTTISGLTDNLDDVTVKIGEKEGDVGCLEAKLVELENENQSLRGNLEETGQKLAVETENSEKLEKSVETLKNTLQVLNQDYEEADKTRKMTDTVQKSAEISTKENDRLNSVIEQQSLAIESLRCKEQEFTLLIKKSGDLKSELETLKTVTSQQKLEIETLRSDQLKSHEIEAKFNAKIEGTRAELETRLRQQTELYGNLRAEMDTEVKLRYESDGQVSELTKGKSELESLVSEQSENVKNMKASIDGYCKKVDELETSLKTAENELNEAKYANAVQSNLELKGMKSQDSKSDLLSKNKPVDEICKNMKELASPSSAKYEYGQVEKECKRLKIRNERLTSTVTDVNQKNRQYQEKLKKYYTLCQQNGLIPGKVAKTGTKSVSKQDGSVKSVGGEASKPTTRTFGGENSVNSQK